ncbi:septation ring formation regulator EzrA [Pueribacillus theae]|uniref:Septation ring formation regulator EzrA n=1 Tax=Pueribacillus theae TaxID=2171751 RepID=A0A2U1K1W1_9BACI|nr:septation ring formation regulator EzrA [Pueribacillus theae]
MLPVGYIIGAVLLLACFIIIGAIIRKKIYNEVDRLGIRKIEILNRPVQDEIAKVKGLNMVGETEKKFEYWRKEWDHIVTVKLPDLEEKLFEAEEASDKYRYRKAKEILKGIDDELNQIDERIEELLEEVNDWVNSEEKNKSEIVSLYEEYKHGKQFLLTHYSSFGKAAPLLEQSFQKIDEGFKQYEEANDEGNYPKARTILLSTKQHMDETKERMEILPELRIQLIAEFPKKIDELEKGIEDMEKQGYMLERQSIKNELEGIRKQIKEELQKVEENHVKDVPEKIKGISDSIEGIYELLENEVEAKHSVVKEKEKLKNEFEVIMKDVEFLKEEVQVVAESYRIDEKDLKSQGALEKRVEQLYARFLLIEEAIEKKEQTYSSIHEMVEEIKAKLLELKQASANYAEMLSNLRKDELEAKAAIESLAKQLINARKLIQRYNLPGIPESYLQMVEESEAKIGEVEEKLNEKPLDIPAINYALKKALESVGHCLKSTEELVETALLSEKLIQYGNRYRSQYDAVAKALNEAEAAFRHFNYEAALEIAAREIEKIDPDALEKLNIENIELETEVSVN